MRKDHSGGFTLLELLGVLTIIGLLAAFLLPGVGQAKRKAQGVQCTSNLRQMGLGLQMFLADYHVYPLFENPNFSEGKYPEHGTGWMAVLERQLGNSNRISSATSVWRCPSAQWGTNLSRSPEIPAFYCYNVFGLFWPGLPRDLGLGGHNTKGLAPPVSEAEVAVPSDMMAIADSFHGGFDLEHNYLRLSEKLGNASSRHQGKVNVVFCDGHVESPKMRFVFEDTNDVALVRWNRDHQPHPEQLLVDKPHR